MGGFRDDTFVIGKVARLAPVKNQCLVVEGRGTNRHADFTLFSWVTGHHALSSKVFREDNWGLNPEVHFAGEVVSRINLNQFFNISVLCSLSRRIPKFFDRGFGGGKTCCSHTPLAALQTWLRKVSQGCSCLRIDPTQLAAALT